MADFTKKLVQAYNDAVKNTPVRFSDKLRKDVESIAPQNKVQDFLKGVAMTGVNTAAFVENPIAAIAPVVKHPIKTVKDAYNYAKDTYIRPDVLKQVVDNPGRTYEDLFNTLSTIEGTRAIGRLIAPKKAAPTQPVRESMGGDAVKPKAKVAQLPNKVPVQKSAATPPSRIENNNIPKEAQGKPVEIPKMENDTVTPQEFLDMPDTISVKDYFLNYAPEALQGPATSTLGPYLMSKYISGKSYGGARSDLANATARNKNGLIFTNRAYGQYRPSNNSIKTVSPMLADENIRGVLGHEGWHWAMNEIEKAAKAGDPKATAYMEKVSDLTGRKENIFHDETVPRAVQGLTDKYYSPRDVFLREMGGSKELYEQAKEFLQPDYNEALYYNLLRKTR